MGLKLVWGICGVYRGYPASGPILRDHATTLRKKEQLRNEDGLQRLITKVTGSLLRAPQPYKASAGSELKKTKLSL